MFNTPPPLSRKTKIVILILVLLLHLLLLIPFITTEFTFLPISPLEQKIKELHKKVHKIKDDEPEEWGTLKSRATQMSAPVILVDDSTMNKADKDEENIESSAQTTPSDNSTHDEPQEKDQADPDFDKQDKEEKTDSLTHDSLQPTLIDIPEDEGTRLIEQKKEEKPTESSAVANYAPSSLKLPPTPKPHKQTPAKPKVQPKKTVASKRPSTKPQPKISLAQLAQGFTDHMKHEGDYTISMSGNDSAKATESQLKIGRFLQRIIGSVQNAWRVNTSRYPLSHPVIVSIHFTIVINKNGTLNKVGIDKSSGNQSVDNYIKLIIQDASTSFPAIPDYMSHDICSIRCTLDEIRLPEGPPGYTIRQ